MKIGMRLRSVALFEQLGPGLVTGAADDDPSGIATYSQAGAQFGFGLLWTMLLTYPLMTAVQLVSAQIGRVTGCGLAKNMGELLWRPLVTGLVVLLFVANTINIGADLAAMGDAVELATGWSAPVHDPVRGRVAAAPAVPAVPALCGAVEVADADIARLCRRAVDG